MQGGGGQWSRRDGGREEVVQSVSVSQVIGPLPGLSHEVTLL